MGKLSICVWDLVFLAVFNRIAVALNIVSFSFIWSSRLTQSQVINKFNTYYYIEYTSPWADFKLTILGDRYWLHIGSYKYNYHTTTIQRRPLIPWECYAYGDSTKYNPSSIHMYKIVLSTQFMVYLIIFYDQSQCHKVFYKNNVRWYLIT